ncbi:metal-dependent hydrolase [Sulfolobus sp. A20]|uniref:metal-dependent hydrolase n=1 Tax=Sulfolobaceae TaxID=118883 RepID=UPI000845D905|nr:MULTISPECIES: metal-dependent hydrolase [unclassified Sulfolobus]AOL16230.1 metal-dependent hydrolase [Sulfolobus sp. A20]TRM76498.1 metal-dependent hydrolase [Sulfolobus sp. B5]TRM97434.1 metal-dependent hydrolase [Sulfolobus sp. B1]TRN03133.1 metal-dependent hydrolase [Sulfolobus sp. F1]
MAQLRWLGHAATLLQIGGKNIIIDPFIKDNPSCPFKLDYFKNNLDIIIVTHDHYDHLGDAVQLIKENPKALLFATYDLEAYLAETYKIPWDNVIPANVGGLIKVDNVNLALTKAVHSSTHSDPTGAIVSADGITIYHAGDTGLFEDMKIIGEVFKPDYVLLPIGGRFTMDPYQASIAVEYLKPKKGAIPIHFNTWDLIKVDENEFVKLVRSKGYNPILLKPGQSIEL